MFGYIYMTTNLTNGRKYIGRKKSKRFLGNAYCGSSNDLNHDVKVNNLDKHKDLKVEIIQECESEKELHDQEMYWIKFYNAVEDPMFYNHHPGGNCRSSGWHHTDVYKAHMSEIQSDGGWMKGKTMAEETKQLMSEQRKGEKHPMYGKHHKDETKEIMSKRKKENPPPQCGPGEANPMYGKIWITNGKERKPVPKEQLPYYESLGYYSRKYSSHEVILRATTIESITDKKSISE